MCSQDRNFSLLENKPNESESDIPGSKERRRSANDRNSSSMDGSDHESDDDGDDIDEIPGHSAELRSLPSSFDGEGQKHRKREDSDSGPESSYGVLNLA